MSLRILKAEQMKLHNSPVWMAFIIIPCISAFMGTFNYINNTEVLTQEWYSLWTQHTLFYCYFCFPALIGIYCSYICRLENMNNNWNTVLTVPVKKSSVYFSKLITVTKVMILTQVLVGILFIISGKAVGFTVPVPSKLLSWLLLGLCASIAITSVQLTLSIFIKSFSIPIGISLIGGILGFAIRAKGYGTYFVYSLFSIGMCANSPDTPMECSKIMFIVSCVIFTIIFSSLGIHKLKYK